MIKVGQIYEDTDGWRFVITLYSPVDIYFVYTNGCTGNDLPKVFKDRKENKFVELIAEYPTWQEAVNSPEFRGEK